MDILKAGSVTAGMAADKQALNLDIGWGCETVVVANAAFELEAEEGLVDVFELALAAVAAAAAAAAHLGSDNRSILQHWSTN